MSSELKPCPFCKGEAKLSEGLLNMTHKFYYANCQSCGQTACGIAATNQENEEICKQKAIEAWNTRVGEANGN